MVEINFCTNMLRQYGSKGCATGAHDPV